MGEPVEKYTPQPPCWLRLNAKRTFLIADPHLLHKNLTQMTGRPENFTDIIVDNLSKLREDETLIVLGDLAPSKRGASLIEKAGAGFKVLIKGNHDRIKSYNLDRYFDVICLAGYSRVKLKKNVSHNVYFFHYPVSASSVSKSIGYHVDYVISGHTHKPPFYDPRKRIVNLSPEVAGYKPINLEELIRFLRKSKGVIHQYDGLINAG